MKVKNKQSVSEISGPTRLIIGAEIGAGMNRSVRLERSSIQAGNQVGSRDGFLNALASYSMDSQNDERTLPAFRCLPCDAT